MMWKGFQMLAAFAGGSAAIWFGQETGLDVPVVNVAATGGFVAYMATLAASRILDWIRGRAEKSRSLHGLDTR
jgi:hypothetical protein